MNNKMVHIIDGCVFFHNKCFIFKTIKLKPKFHNIKVKVSMSKVSMNLNNESWEAFHIILLIIGKLDPKIVHVS